MSIFTYKKMKPPNWEASRCKLTKKYMVPVKTEDGKEGHVLLTQEQIDKIKEKIEIREVFK